MGQSVNLGKVPGLSGSGRSANPRRMNPAVASLVQRECPERAEDDSESPRRGQEPLISELCLPGRDRAGGSDLIEGWS